MFDEMLLDAYCNLYATQANKKMPTPLVLKHIRAENMIEILSYPHLPPCREATTQANYGTFPCYLFQVEHEASCTLVS